MWPTAGGVWRNPSSSNKHWCWAGWGCMKLSWAMRRTDPSCGKSKEIKMEMQFGLRFTLLPWQDVFLLTLQNTASNLASAIKRTIKRLPRPPQMLPHLITAWKKQEETSVVADSQGRKRVALPSFPPQGVFIFDRRLCQLLQQLHLSCLHFQDLGARNYHKERKDHQNGSRGDGWRMI